LTKLPKPVSLNPLMRKAFLLTTFSLLTPFVLVLTLSLLIYTCSLKNNLLTLSKNPRVAYAALPPASGSLKMTLTAQDARVAIVKDFLKKYNSELLPYAQHIVDAADKYNLDYRLVPAIAMQESNLCKKAPKDSHNCWGFGIYGKQVLKFDNYTDAINTVTKTLAIQYVGKGLQTPEQIMTRYTPGSNGSWARGVNTFMNQLAVAL
jgi:hypothetical protein